MDTNEKFLSFLNAVCSGNMGSAEESLEDIVNRIRIGEQAPKFPGGSTPVPMAFIVNMYKMLQAHKRPQS